MITVIAVRKGDVPHSSLVIQIIFGKLKETKSMLTVCSVITFSKLVRSTTTLSLASGPESMMSVILSPPNRRIGTGTAGLQRNCCKCSTIVAACSRRELYLIPETIREIATPNSVHGIGAPGTIEQLGLLGDVPDSSLENSLSEGSASSFSSYQISGGLTGHI